MSRIANVNFLFVVFFTTMLQCSWPTQALESEAALCAEAIEVPIHHHFSGDIDDGGETHVFRLRIPAAGLISLDVVAVDSGQGAARIGLIDGRCTAGEGKMSDLIVIEEGITRLLLWAEGPRTVVFRVAAQDPRLSLQNYRTSIGFVEADVVFGEFAHVKDLEEGEREDPGEIEIEPWLLPPVEKERSIAVDPLEALQRHLCRSTVFDDHGDTLTCATSLHSISEVLHGTIGGGLLNHRDDSDVFVFHLTERRTVDLKIRAEMDVLVALQDHRGHRLAKARGESGGDGEEASVRFVKTLAAGFYFVRVGGVEDGEGAYFLNFETSIW